MPQAERAQGRTVAQVMLDSSLPQLDRIFDYAIPEHLAEQIRVGQRVRVPLRAQRRGSHGYIVAFSERSEFAGKLQPISDIVSPMPLLTPSVWNVARAVADRACGSASDIVRLAIPPRSVRTETRHLAAGEQTAATGEAAATNSEAAPATGAAAAFVPGTAAAPAAGATAPQSNEHALAARLIAASRIAVTAPHHPERLSTGAWVGGWVVQLAKIALAVHASGHSAILALPDYRDVSQLHDTLIALGHTDAVRLDAKQAPSARYGAFLRALDPVPRIIIGNRSAVYAPAHRLGAIMVWDDGDPLLAEPLSPYVHARDAALVRASIEPCGLLFAAHARSAEVQRLIAIGYLHAAPPSPRRARVIAADAVQHADRDTARLPEFAARTIRDGLTSGPVLVQVAAPGYAPAAVCADCGARARCTTCGGPMGFHEAKRAACRWCGEHAWRCPSCDGATLTQRGADATRTVEQFARQFPHTRVILSDGTHPHDRVDSRSALVVATRGAEPIAAGGYRAVVLLDAERLLGIESLRAGEDCLRWWLNAVALAAADARCVLASGGGATVRALATGTVDEWLRAELRDRKQLRYPPMVRVASISGGAAAVARAIDTLADLPGVDVLGPTPHPHATARHEPAPTPAPTPEPASDHAATVPLRQRAIVRFEYSQGAKVAARLRAAVLADIAGASSRVSGRTPKRTQGNELRVRFDDRGVFDT